MGKMAFWKPSMKAGWMQLLLSTKRLGTSYAWHIGSSKRTKFSVTTASADQGLTLMKNTTIEWTDHTFNPWWGCVKVSPACEHCYAKSIADRFGGTDWRGGGKRRFFGPEHWSGPLQWNAEANEIGVRSRVFCASMADVFEDRRDLNTERDRLWKLIDR